MAAAMRLLRDWAGLGDPYLVCVYRRVSLTSLVFRLPDQ